MRTRILIPSLAALALLASAPAAGAQSVADETARAQRSADRACRTTFSLFGCVPALTRVRLIAQVPHRLVFWQELYGGTLDGNTWKAQRAYARIDRPRPRQPHRRITVTTAWRCTYSDAPTEPPRPCFGGGNLPGEYGGGTL